MRVTCQIKAILTRHWVDQKELRISVHRGTVRLSGMIKRLAAGEGCDISTSWLAEIVAEMRRVPGVEKVYFLDVTVDTGEEHVSPGKEALSVQRRAGSRKANGSSGPVNPVLWVGKKKKCPRS